MTIRPCKQSQEEGGNVTIQIIKGNAFDNYDSK